MSGPVRVDDEGSTRILTLDRPPANALDESLLVALEEAVADATADDRVRAVVLRGEGAFFSGGFDLAAERREGEAVERMVRAYRSSHRALLACPKPLVAAIGGHAVAGGLVLALACEHRLAAEGSYRVGFTEVAIGATFPPVALEIVRLRLSDAALAALILRAELHPATALVRAGAVEELVPAAELDERARALAARLASYPREVYAHMKGALVADALARLDAVTLDEELRIAALWSADESRAARERQRAALRGERSDGPVSRG